MTETIIVPSLYDYSLSDALDNSKLVSKPMAETVMAFFKQQPLFKWEDNNNFCEARADAMSVLLDEWQVHHYKAWVFGGNFLRKHVGGLKQHWNYHVAVLLPVMQEGKPVHYIIDPSTSTELQTLSDWAAAITEYPHSYQVVKEAHWYIFPEKTIDRDNWHCRNRRNRKWMVQGLAGVNGLTARGRAVLAFHKARIKNSWTLFENLKRERPLKNLI